MLCVHNHQRFRHPLAVVILFFHVSVTIGIMFLFIHVLALDLMSGVCGGIAWALVAGAAAAGRLDHSLHVEVSREDVSMAQKTS